MHIKKIVCEYRTQYIFNFLRTLLYFPNFLQRAFISFIIRKKQKGYYYFKK